MVWACAPFDLLYLCNINATTLASQFDKGIVMELLNLKISYHLRSNIYEQT